MLTFPEDFFNEQVRCDYTVTADMKRVWGKDLELYEVFCELCEKHNIKHYIAYGNLLGAVRHGGFIPWDDDMDVFVTRADYERLCEVAPKELGEQYFWQNDHTDWSSHIAFSKLRLNNTTAILDFEKPYGYKFNQGMFLDVFPLDNAPDDEAEWQAHKKRLVLLKKLTGKWSRLFEGTKIYFNRPPMYILAVLCFIPRVIIRAFKIPNLPCRLLERQLKKYQSTEAACYTMAALGETKKYPKSCFEQTVMLPYEFISVPAPANYKQLLDTDYGDWSVFVRGTAGGSMHDGMFYDTENSYLKYI